MFSGIIESIGKITRIETKSYNRIFTIYPAPISTGSSSINLSTDVYPAHLENRSGVKTPIAIELKISDSIAIDGCCLTVINSQNDTFKVEAVSETLKTTTLASLKIGGFVNLERARTLTDRFEGHIVQGHVDEKAKITNIRKTPGSITIEIQLSKTGIDNVIDKGSVAIDGISLTIAKIKGTKFNINIIPYTFNNTTLKHKRIGDWVNIEFDVIGKYVRKFLIK